MITAGGVITDIIVDNTKVWLQVTSESKAFPVHYEFDTSLLSDITRLMFLIERTKAKDIKDLLGKSVRIIDTEELNNSLIAMGDATKNKFVDLYGSEFPVSERRIYGRYRHKR